MFQNGEKTPKKIAEQEKHLSDKKYVGAHKSSSKSMLCPKTGEKKNLESKVQMGYQIDRI